VKKTLDRSTERNVLRDNRSPSLYEIIFPSDTEHKHCRNSWR